MNKAVFITGANGGIGKALVNAFSKEGWFIIGSDHPENIPSENLLEICGEWIPLDLETLATNKNKVEEFSKILKYCINKNSLNLTGVIQNAAFQIVKPFKNLSMDDWKTSLNINLLSIVCINKILIPYLESNNGSILHIGSIHRKLTKSNFSAYATTKAALFGLTNSMAVELGSKIRVNIIEPAAIETDMLRAGFENDELKLKKLKKLHPTNSIGNPEDISKAALFLLDSKNSFINGSSIDISGGINRMLHDL